MSEKYAAGISSAFILFGNVSDYALPNVYLTRFLTGSFNNENSSRDVVIYNIGTGFDFPTPGGRDSFIRRLGLDSTQGRVKLQRLGLDSTGPSKHDVNAALLAITEFLQKSGGVKKDESTGKFIEQRKAAVIVENSDMLFPAGDARQKDDRIDLNVGQSWGRDPKIQGNGNLVILLSGSLAGISPTLRAASAGFEAVEVDMPNTTKRREYIDWYLDDDSESAPTFEMKVDRHFLAATTSALKLINIEDIFLRAEQVGELTSDMIYKRKSEVIRSEYDDVIDWYKAEIKFSDVGDLEHVKAAFRRLVIEPMNEGGESLLRVPMGVLMTGAAGTGKTIIAEALATEAGVNFVNLNLSQIFSMWVGESEKKIERLIRALKALAPVIVFIDEIDKAITQDESGDSGVSQRVFRSLQVLMSDTSHRGEIMFLAATNRPDRIAPALMRAGRFDKIIPFFVPTEEGRDSIIRVMARKYGKLNEFEPTAESLTLTDGWTGAEIEGAAVKALEISHYKKIDFAPAFEEATRLILRNTQDVELMTHLGLLYCNDLDLIPVEYHEQARNRGGLQKAVDSETQAVENRRGPRDW